MKFRVLVLSIWLLFFSALAYGGKTPPNWKDWDMYPDATRYTADQVQKLLLAGEKMVFIYAGYETDNIVCGSTYIPYTWVPPVGDGSRVNLSIPKDTWIVAYCP